MAKKAEYLKDRYRSIRNKYPKVNENSLTDEVMDAIKSEVETKYEITQVVVEDSEPVGFSIKDNENDVIYNIDLSGGGKQLYQHNIIIKDTNRDNCRIYIEIPTDNQTSFDFNSLKAWLTDKCFSNNHMYKANGNWIFDNTAYDIEGVGYLSTKLFLNGITKDGTTLKNKELSNTNLSFEDSVITL